MFSTPRMVERQFPWLGLLHQQTFLRQQEAMTSWHQRRFFDDTVVPHWRSLGPEVEATHRRERILENRWWSAEEIEASSERILPLDLAKRVREFGGRPS